MNLEEAKEIIKRFENVDIHQSLPDIRTYWQSCGFLEGHVAGKKETVELVEALKKDRQCVPIKSHCSKCSRSMDIGVEEHL